MTNRRPFGTIGIAEFPKAGITMFTHGLIHALGQLEAPPHEATWFNQNLVIRDVETAGRPGVSDFRFRFEKTHNRNFLEYNSIFLMRRDWRTHMASWFDYSRVHFGWTGNFAAFLASPSGVSAYEKFMYSYGHEAAPWQRIVVIDHEDMLTDSAKVYRRVLTHLGYGNGSEVTEAAQRAAIRVARAEMVASEEFYTADAITRREVFVKPEARNVRDQWENIAPSLTARLEAAYVVKPQCL
jgi:hypothetical protein